MCCGVAGGDTANRNHGGLGQVETLTVRTILNETKNNYRSLSRDIMKGAVPSAAPQAATPGVLGSPLEF